MWAWICFLNLFIVGKCCSVERCAPWASTQKIKVFMFLQKQQYGSVLRPHKHFIFLFCTLVCTLVCIHEIILSVSFNISYQHFIHCGISSELKKTHLIKKDEWKNYLLRVLVELWRHSPLHTPAVYDTRKVRYPTYPIFKLV